MATVLPFIQKRSAPHHSISTQANSIDAPSHQRFPLQHSANFYGKRHEQFPFRRYGLWHITAGYVRTLTWSAEGESVPLGFWKEGDIFGYPITQTHPYLAQCLSEVKAEYLGQQYQPSQGELISQTIQSNQLLSISHCRQGGLRLLKFLCWLAERFGQADEKGHHVKIRLTHQEIAESTGLTRVTVTRLIKKLEKQNKLRWCSQEKVIYNKTVEQFWTKNSL